MPPYQAILDNSFLHEFDSRVLNGAFEVIGVNEFPNLPSGILEILVILQIDLVVFEGAEPAFNHDIVSPPALAIHADLNLLLSTRLI